MPYIIGTIGKRSLLSLVLIILHHTDPTDMRNTSALAEEERGEMAFAIRTTEYLLKWMGMTVQDAKNAVQNYGPYYSGGDEHVEIPAVPEGGRDAVFPDMDDLL